ncbi:hypothetical protein EVAR_99893_1 [Eumeta japonica]|uniref:Uncharacterized protein n=1 Tax=Eumeta variegata TaxID=151549 RepID=A0A4C2A8L7_EUMVA|nr:hypothetical protein EVAR_99893_1 [Eumeta japonica]
MNRARGNSASVLCKLNEDQRIVVKKNNPRNDQSGARVLMKITITQRPRVRRWLSIDKGCIACTFLPVTFIARQLSLKCVDYNSLVQHLKTTRSNVIAERFNPAKQRARGRPIIVEWERRADLAGLSRSVTHRYVTERYTFSKLILPHAGASASTSSRENQWRDSVEGSGPHSVLVLWNTYEGGRVLAKPRIELVGRYRVVDISRRRSWVRAGTSCHELHRDGPAPVTRLLQSSPAPHWLTCLWWSRTSTATSIL